MSASKLSVRNAGAIILGGPRGSEATARARLEEVLYDHLSACYYLDDSGRAAHYAEKWAAEVPYQVKGREIVVRLRLDVMYSNHPGRWKWWVRLRTDERGVTTNTVSPGTPG